MRSILQPDWSQFRERADHSDSNAKALVRLVCARVHPRLAPQKAPPRDHAALRARVFVDLAWKRREDSRRSRRIFHPSFRADRFFGIELVQSTRAAPRFLSPAQAHLPK